MASTVRAGIWADLQVPRSRRSSCGRPLVLALALCVAVVHSPARAGAQVEQPTTEEQEHDHKLGGDVIEVFVRGGESFVDQFTHADTLVILGGTAALSLALSWRELEVQNRLEDFDVVGDNGFLLADIAGSGLNFPVVPLGAYVWGRFAGNERLIHFSAELATTQLVLGLEVIALSYVPYFHTRPEIERGEVGPDEQTFLDGTFRGSSGYPSGHVVGLSALAIKGWEWYGWRLGAPVTAVALFTGWARIQEGKHFLSDVLATYALAGATSIAVSRTRDAPTQAAFSGNLLKTSDDHKGPSTVLTPTLLPGGAGFTLGGVF